tara:strand:- start:249 stop:1109 length:861 start_codon:yes stop_codon:yes gene_type:complete
MNWYKKRYNKKSAKKHGWHPSWFASFLTEFDEELLDEIVKFQVEHDLKPDGFVGPVTFRRLLANQELNEIEREGSENFLLINGRDVPIEWDTKIDLIKPGAFRKSRGVRKPNMIVTHWDACTSAAGCKRVLEAKNISTHFCIDNDGIIYQYLDTNNIGWHAGSVNSRSIGIDFSNAYYTKYNKLYVKRGFSERPVLKNSYVHGRKLKPHLGYYAVQIEAYKKLLEVLCHEYDIPLEVPEKDGRLLTGVHNGATAGKFNGVVCHYHITRGKIDCAGLKLKEIVDSLC